MNSPSPVLPVAHDAFLPLRQERIESLNLVIEHYQHRETGAVHYHLAADSRENVFLVALRTVPEDSRGVAHILEHTALCGSTRYPVRDPFFMMLRRSLNTFMNAFTSSDWTAYPFASQNQKDFGNFHGWMSSTLHRKGTALSLPMRTTRIAIWYTRAWSSMR
ncbi:MAG: Zn-dependent M16 (insulinase) family peptidase [Halieaceae bacterium]|jgi:Zn-dependent M16 (insulinase) family peptidase